MASGKSTSLLTTNSTGRSGNEAFIESLKKAREEIAQGKKISHEDLKKELGIE